jgi:thymidylate kinase
MLVEFVGLPGCGKTTLVMQLEKQLFAEGHRAKGLRNATSELMIGLQDKIGFLRQRKERVSLYGCLVFAHENPKLFDKIFGASRDDFVALIWGMETLSQIGIIQKHGPKDLVVLNEEGFLQRLSWSYLDREDGPELAEVIALLPPDFVSLHMTLPPEVAYARSQDRRKGVPTPLKGNSDAEAILNFDRYDAKLRQSTKLRRAQGGTVLEIDASMTIDAVLEAALTALRPLLSLPVAPKRRKVKP